MCSLLLRARTIMPLDILLISIFRSRVGRYYPDNNNNNSPKSPSAAWAKHKEMEESVEISFSTEWLWGVKDCTHRFGYTLPPEHDCFEQNPKFREGLSSLDKHREKNTVGFWTNGTKDYYSKPEKERTLWSCSPSVSGWVRWPVTGLAAAVDQNLVNLLSERTLWSR